MTRKLEDMAREAALEQAAAADLERMAREAGLERNRGLWTSEQTDGVEPEDLARLVALVRADECARCKAAIGPTMPADFKDWHENADAELPGIAAWVIEHRAKEARADALEQAARLCEAATFNRIDKARGALSCAAAIRALKEQQ